MELHTVLRRPILTEKTTRGMEQQGAYVFEVDGGANKVIVRRAIESIFDVKVAKVNIRNRKGKLKRTGRSVGYTKDHKEAIVTLRAGHKIDIY